MFDFTKLRWRARRAAKMQAVLFERYSTLANNNRSEEATVAMREYQNARQDLETAEMAIIILQLAKYRLPLPDMDDKERWFIGESGLHILNTKGYAEVRSAIRNEKNERWHYWETRLRFFGWLSTGLTGVIGTTIGLVATLKH